MPASRVCASTHRRAGTCLPHHASECGYRSHTRWPHGMYAQPVAEVCIHEACRAKRVHGPRLSTGAAHTLKREALGRSLHRPRQRPHHPIAIPSHAHHRGHGAVPTDPPRRAHQRTRVACGDALDRRRHEPREVLDPDSSGHARRRAASVRRAPPAPMALHATSAHGTKYAASRAAAPQ